MVLHDPAAGHTPPWRRGPDEAPPCRTRPPERPAPRRRGGVVNRSRSSASRRASPQRSRGGPRGRGSATARSTSELPRIWRLSSTGRAQPDLELIVPPPGPRCARRRRCGSPRPPETLDLRLAGDRRWRLAMRGHIPRPWKVGEAHGWIRRLRHRSVVTIGQDRLRITPVKPSESSWSSVMTSAMVCP